jgi:hypothetical protein
MTSAVAFGLAVAIVLGWCVLEQARGRRRGRAVDRLSRALFAAAGMRWRRKRCFAPSSGNGRSGRKS